MSDIDHGARDHATWSASSTERNWNCAGALALTKDMPETTNEAADWGTCCHQISEACLRDGTDAVRWLDETVKGKEHEFVVDDEMCETAQVYVDYVQEASIFGVHRALWVEQRFSLEKLKPPFDAGGTADAVIYDQDSKTLEVVDLKGGRGVVVEAKGNKQARTYGLGAVLAHPGLEVEWVKTTIVQPRADHPDGRTRSETIHIADLIEWTTDLKAVMIRAAEALAVLPSAFADEDEWAEWRGAYLAAGDHCKFCKAAGACPTLREKVYAEGRVWFSDEGEPTVGADPREMSPEDRRRALDAADMIGDWINAVRRYAHQRAEAGDATPEYQLAKKVGQRAWAEDADRTAQALREKGLTLPFVRKLMSPSQAEKALGLKAKGLDDMTVRSSNGTNLVRVTKTNRKAETPKVHQLLTPIGENDGA